jgi:hypothetical protein
MLTCLIDYIGIKGSNRTAPISGLYVNSLPGVTIDAISKMASSDNSGYLEAWDDVQQRAISKLALDTNTILSKRYRLRRIARSLDLGSNVDTAHTVEAAEEYRGFTIEQVFKNAANLTFSNHQVLSVQSLSIYLNYVPQGNVIIYLYDLSTGLLVDSFQITNPQVGTNTVVVEKLYTTRRLFVCYDSTNIDSVTQYINPQADILFMGWLDMLYGKNLSDGFVRGAKANNVQTPAYGVNSFGLSAVFSFICEYDGMICANKRQFAKPLWYLLGAELMVDRIFADNINRYTTTDREKAKELHTYFMELYESELKDLLNSTNIDTADKCIECNSQINTVYMAM